MSKIIACIDGSSYADQICAATVWASERTKAALALLHVIDSKSNIAEPNNLSGSLGLGAKSDLLEELAEIDAARGKIELKKGQLMLKHAEEELAAQNITNPELMHRHGSLVETIKELEAEISLIIMGKRGEQANYATEHLGSNLERTIRAIHKPALIIDKSFNKVSSFLLAYDGSATSKKALAYIINNPLLKGLKCHLLKIGEQNSTNQEIMAEAEIKLTQAGFNLTSNLISGSNAAEVINNYCVSNAVDLLVIGAYGHSKIRNLILGSVTTTLIKKSQISLLLLR